MVLDVWLQGSRLDGIQVLEEITRDHPDLPVVIISGHGTIETAVAAIKKGAYDFIEKPFKADKLCHTVRRALESARLKRQMEELKLKAGDDTDLCGNSTAIAQLRQLVDKIAPTGSRVLITGPSGSGKEVTARLIHSLLAARRQRLHCGELRHDGARAHRGRTVRRGIRSRYARSGCWSLRMAARCSSTKRRTCRWRPRAKSCAF